MKICRVAKEIAVAQDSYFEAEATAGNSHVDNSRDPNNTLIRRPNKDTDFMFPTPLFLHIVKCDECKRGTPAFLHFDETEIQILSVIPERENEDES